MIHMTTRMKIWCRLWTLFNISTTRSIETQWCTHLPPSRPHKHTTLNRPRNRPHCFGRGFCAVIERETDTYCCWHEPDTFIIVLPDEHARVPPVAKTHPSEATRVIIIMLVLLSGSYIVKDFHYKRNITIRYYWQFAVKKIVKISTGGRIINGRHTWRLSQ